MPGIPRPETVAPLRLARLAELLPAALTGDDVEVTGITHDSRDVRAGDLYAALAGANRHGAEFAAGAAESGAVAVLTDAAGLSAASAAGLPVLVADDPRAVLGAAAAAVYGDPSARLTMIGITGTAGKTSTAYLVESGLREAGRTTGLIGTVETRIAGERLVSGFTTPEAPDLQALLAVMVERGVTHVPMEVSSHALALGRANGVRFAVGAFTNLSQDHLDFHHDMEQYFAAKSLLFDGRSTTEVVVVDSAWGQALLRPQTVTVSTDPGTEADWRATDLEATAQGEQTFTLHGPDGLSTPARIPLPGEFNVANAVLAAAILSTAGVSLEHIVAGLAAVQVPGRMERVYVGQEFTAVVDYAHKPAAVAQGLDALRARTDGRIITVLGCGGDRDTAKRPMMGEAAARRSDVLIVTDDNPRSEDPAAIRAAMLAGARSVGPAEGGEIAEIGDRREAIAHAVALAGPGDIVFLAGKGHESGQEAGGVVHPFSDRDELAAAIRNKLEVSV